MGSVRSHYDNLKVARDAPPEVIRAAYRTLAQKYHPDRGPGSTKAAQIMQLINNAYEVLSDPEQRREHDAWLATEEGRVASNGTHQPPPREESPRPREEVPRPREEAPRPRQPAPESPSAWAGTVGEQLGRPSYDDPDDLREDVFDIVAAVLRKHGFVVVVLALIGLGWLAWISGALDRRPSVVEEAPTPSVGFAAPAPSPPTTMTPTAAPQDAPVELAPWVRPPLTPKGEPWPAEAGYLSGYPTFAETGDGSLVVDNSQGSADVFAKLMTFGAHAYFPERYFFIPAGGRFTLEHLERWPYILFYQELDTGTRASAGPFNFDRSAEVSVQLEPIPNVRPQSPLAPDEFDPY
jgi:hypothetical protein